MDYFIEKGQQPHVEEVAIEDNLYDIGEMPNCSDRHSCLQFVMCTKAEIKIKSQGQEETNVD